MWQEKLHFNEMMMMSFCIEPTHFNSWIVIVLAH